MGVQCCGEERRISSSEKKRLLDGKDPQNSFRFNMNEEETKKKGGRVTFADPPDDS